MGRRHSAETRRRIGAGVRATPRRRIPVSERLWEKVEIVGTCWLWTARPSKNGYGGISLGGQRAPRVYAHRLAYELLVGPIPPGLVLDHLCFNKLCVNPDHLEPVTAAENTRRWSRTKEECARVRGQAGVVVPFKLDRAPRCRVCREKLPRGCPQGGRCSACRALASEPRHGTRSRYINRRCRCVECRNANAAYERERKAVAA